MRYWLMVIFLCVCGTSISVCGAIERQIYLIEAEADETGHSYLWTASSAAIAEGYKTEEEMYQLFAYLFEAGEYCIPEGVCVLGIKLEDGHLTVNVSGDILLYGGNAYETALIAQCKRTALAQPEVESFTLLIDGLLQPLAEGRTVEGFTMQARTEEELPTQARTDEGLTIEAEAN